MAQTEKQMILKPTSEPCFDFTNDGSTRIKKTVIISPLQVEEYDDKAFRIAYGCSRGAFCRDAECKYVEKMREVSGIDVFSSQLDM